MVVKQNSSLWFVTQMFEFEEAPVKVFDNPFFVNTYLVDPAFDESFNGHLYVLYKNGLSDNLVNFLTSHKAFKTTYCPKDGFIMYVFSYNAEQIEGVVKPFLSGSFSKIDRLYVERYFPAVATHHNYTTRKVLDKHPDYREYWKRRIGVELPDNAEVWTKPNIKDETFNLRMVYTVPEA